MDMLILYMNKSDYYVAVIIENPPAGRAVTGLSQGREWRILEG